MSNAHGPRRTRFVSVEVQAQWQWRTEAACAETDPEVFFAKTIWAKKFAKRICEDCPVAERCLQWALDNPQHASHGIWGGLEPRQRRRLLRTG